MGKREEKYETPKKMHQLGDDDYCIKKINLRCIKSSYLWEEKRGEEEKEKHRYLYNKTPEKEKILNKLNYTSNEHKHTSSFKRDLTQFFKETKPSSN